MFIRTRWNFNRVYRTDLPICAGTRMNLRSLQRLGCMTSFPLTPARKRMPNGWNGTRPSRSTRARSWHVRRGDAGGPACRHHHLQRRREFLRLVAPLLALWRNFGTQLAPTAGAMGYGPPAAVAAALRHPDACVVALAGDGDFMMNGQELATAVQYGVNMLVLVIDNGVLRHDPHASGTRISRTRVSGTTLHNPDFAALARAYGGWAETVETTADFAPALSRAMKEKGLRLLHLKTDPERISAGTTISALRAAKSK
jgi:hypothetical protein